jgi:hypothetical protein
MTEEEHLVRAFFLPEKRDRYLGFIHNPKKRRKFLAEMAHFKGLDENFKQAIPSRLQTVEGILSLLEQLGASITCLAISDDKEVDGKILSLQEALGTVMGRTFATFLSCKPGKLAYFENEDGRWILKRP